MGTKGSCTRNMLQRRTEQGADWRPLNVPVLAGKTPSLKSFVFFQSLFSVISACSAPESGDGMKLLFYAMHLDMDWG